MSKYTIDKIRITYILIAILIVGLLLRLHNILYVEYEPFIWDQLEYSKLAIQLIEHEIYGYRETVTNALVTPGFPIFLFVIFKIVGYEPMESTLFIIRLLQCMISIGAVWLIYKIGCRLFNPKTGLLAAFLAAVHPSFVWSTSLILTEVIFLTSFMALIHMQVRIIQENRKWDHVWMGLLLGITVLIRPNILPLAIVPYVFLWFTHRKLYVLAILSSVGAFALVMSPWWIRNLFTFHEFIFIAKGEAGNPLLGGTDPYFKGTIDWAAIDEKDQSAEAIRRIKQGLQEDPWLWIKWFTIGKFTYMFKAVWVGKYPALVGGLVFKLLLALHYFTVFIGFPAIYIKGWFRQSYVYLAVSLGIVLGIHLVFIPTNRYTYGMMPFLMLAASHIVITLIQYTSGRFAARGNRQLKL